MEKWEVKTNKAKLKTLENELMTLIQWSISVSQYFTKAKSISSEIVELAPDEMPKLALIELERYRPINKLYITKCLESRLRKRKKKCLVTDGMLEGKVNKVRQAWAKGEHPKADNKEGRIKEDIKVHINGELSQSEIIKRVKILARSKWDFQAFCAIIDDGEEEIAVSCIEEPRIERGQTIVRNSSINRQDDWIVGSGCSNYMTKDKEKLSSATEYKEEELWLLSMIPYYQYPTHW
ncbi:hypothetical protein Golax_017636 [Gossypium laxum]|uniref:Uncharacterized protein n=1 Tax=Gossypium laxum TaxID=34288 RepID=A0A7J8Z251_9ROSI|nr:hypothetical protein [Gossypium laxum]